LPAPQVREDVAGVSFLAIGSAAPEIVINAIGVTKSFKAAGAVVAGSGGSGGGAAATAVCC
jgi:Ca2+/Na+ antiporter